MESSKIDDLRTPPKKKKLQALCLSTTRQYLLGTTDTNVFLGIVNWLPVILWTMLSSDVNQVKHVWDTKRALRNFLQLYRAHISIYSHIKTRLTTRYSSNTFDKCKSQLQDT